MIELDLRRLLKMRRRQPWKVLLGIGQDIQTHPTIELLYESFQLWMVAIKLDWLCLSACIEACMV